MSGRDNCNLRPDLSPHRGKGSTYVADRHRELFRSYNPPPSFPVGCGRQYMCSRDSRSKNRYAASLDVPLHHEVFKRPSKNYMLKANSWRFVNLEEFKVKHGLQGFVVKFFGDGDDLTYDMISTYPYDSTHLLTTIGQIEAGMRLPLYRTNDSFCYDVLASRHRVYGSDQRSVVQYNGNWYRILDECRMRQRGQSRLTCYVPDPAQRDWYTPENFNSTYKDYISPSNRKKWSIGPCRRKFSDDQLVAGERPLLEELDKGNIKVVPGTEGSDHPVPFPKTQKIRVGHDFKWHRTPIEIIGPWAWGWSPSPTRVGQPRNCAPERYGDYCPWRLNCDDFRFDYSEEEQYDFSVHPRVSKKQKVSRESTNFGFVDDVVVEVTSPDAEDDDAEDEEESEGENLGDNVSPDRTPSSPVDQEQPKQIVESGTDVHDRDRALSSDLGASSSQPEPIVLVSVSTGFGQNVSVGATIPSQPAGVSQVPLFVQVGQAHPNVSQNIPVVPLSQFCPVGARQGLPAVGVNQILFGDASGDSFSFGPPIQHISQSEDLATLESDIPHITIPDSPLFDEGFVLIDRSVLGDGKGSEASKGVEKISFNSKDVEKDSSVAEGTGVGSLLASHVASTSRKDAGVSVDSVGVDMSDLEAVHQWALKHGLLAVPATALAVEGESALTAEIRDKMRVNQHDYVRDTFLNSDRIFSSLHHTPAPVVSVQEMTRLVDGHAYFFPQFTMATLSQNQQYCFELYQLHKLRATTFESLFRACDADLVVKRDEVCTLQQQLLDESEDKEHIRFLEQENELLKKEMSYTKTDLEKENKTLKEELLQARADLEKTAPGAEVVKQMGKIQAELDASKVDVVALQGKVSHNEGLVSSAEKRATLAEAEAGKLQTVVSNLQTEVGTLKTQAIARAQSHIADVMRVKREDREKYKVQLNAFLLQVNKDTGRDYQPMP